MLWIKRKCTWHVRLIPASKNNAKEAKTSYTSELLCSSIVDLPQHKTIIAKSDNGASNNFWRTEKMIVLTNLKESLDGPTAQLPNNATMNATKTGIIQQSGSLIAHAKKAHIFDGPHSASLISLCQFFDDNCIVILDKNEINILKNKKLILKGNSNKIDGLQDIPISRPLKHSSHKVITRDNTKSELIQYLHYFCFSTTPRSSLKSIEI